MVSSAPNPGGPWERGHPDARAVRVDAVAAALLFVGALLSCWLYARSGMMPHPAPAWVCALWAFVAAAPLALRRRHPIPVLLVVAVAFFAGQELHVPEMLFSNITFFLALYSVGAWTRNRTAALLVRGIVIAVMFVWVFTALLGVGGSGAGGLSTAGAFSPFLAFGLLRVLTNLLYFGAAYFFGEAAYRSARSRAALEERTAELDAERERTAAQAVALERVRIARELHDVVAHHVSLMGVQAGAARRILADDPARAEESLHTIEDSARTAVDELHLLLRALRDEDGTEPPESSSSTRGLASLPELVDEAGEAGLPTRSLTVGAPHAVPAPIQLSAYRVAQEALTNARKHAGPAASAEVRLRYLGDALEVEVVDDGRGSGPHGTGGLGQVGMRERVAAVGGTIEIGPRARGGYLVRARFPLDPAQDVKERP